jgi:hypothetical protein
MSYRIEGLHAYYFRLCYSTVLIFSSKLTVVEGGRTSEGSPKQESRAEEAHNPPRCIR